LSLTAHWMSLNLGPWLDLSPTSCLTQMRVLQHQIAWNMAHSSVVGRSFNS
jgi:hypothetical protein